MPSQGATSLLESDSDEVAAAVQVKVPAATLRVPFWTLRACSPSATSFYAFPYGISKLVTASCNACAIAVNLASLAGKLVIPIPSKASQFVINIKAAKATGTKLFGLSSRAAIRTKLP